MCTFLTVLQGKTIDLVPTDNVNLVVSQSADFDTLQFNEGIYLIDSLVIDRKLTLIGRPGARLESKSGNEILTIISSDVNVHHLHFSGVETNYLKEHAAIHIIRSARCTISNNYIDDCFFGIYLQHVKHVQVIDNVIVGTIRAESASGNAIHAWYCDSLFISGNQVIGHRDGIYFEFVHNSVIRNNHSERNSRYGLHFMFSNHDVYQDNTFLNNGVGVAVMFSGNITMQRNIFKDNWGRAAYGLLLKEIRDATITDNRFEYNTIGIYVEGSSRIEYFHNHFIRNGCSLKISGGCAENKIEKNNFIENHLDMEMHGGIDGATIRGNYWSGYTGYDLDKDLVGDVPYYPVKLFSHVLSKSPEAIVLMRSLLVDLINFAESVSPVFTPVEIQDASPSMKPLP